MTLVQRLTVATAFTVVALIATGFVTAPAADATSYRYWTYWVGGVGTWDFSTRGADRLPADGTVDGWRFAVSDAAGTSSQPSVSSSFDVICKDTDPVSGMKRVGLVVDYGTRSDAPRGQDPPAGVVARCLVLQTTATGYDALAAATSIRIAGGLICGISGYPRSGCGEPVAEPKPPQANDSELAVAGNTAGHTQPHPDPTPPGDDRNNEVPSDQHSLRDGTGRPNQATAPSPALADTFGAAQTDVEAALRNEIPDQPGGRSPLGAIAGLVLVLVLAAAGLSVARRRR